LYVSTYKDVKNKVVEFSDSPSNNITDLADEIVPENEEFEMLDDVNNDDKPKLRGPNFQKKDKTTMSVEVG
jgi:hypothetical protein